MQTKNPTTRFSASFACVTAVTVRPLISWTTTQVEDEKPPPVREAEYKNYFSWDPSVCAVAAAMQISSVGLFLHWQKKFVYIDCS